MKIWIGEAAERLEVSVSTVKVWCDRLGIANDRDSRGRRLLSLQEISALEAVKVLRGEGNGLDTIQRRISSSGDCQFADSRLIGDGLSAASQPLIDTDAIVAKVGQVVAFQMGAFARLSERFGDLQRQIGQLETENQFLRAQLAEKEKKPWWKVNIW